MGPSQENRPSTCPEREPMLDQLKYILELSEYRFYHQIKFIRPGVHSLEFVCMCIVQLPYITGIPICPARQKVRIMKIGTKLPTNVLPKKFHVKNPVNTYQ